MEASKAFDNDGIFQRKSCYRKDLNRLTLVSLGGLDTLTSFQKALQSGDRKAIFGSKTNLDFYFKDGMFITMKLCSVVEVD